MNQRIDTKLGIVIIVIIAITAGVFVWRYEKEISIVNVPIKQNVSQRNQIDSESTEKKPVISEAIAVKGWNKYTPSDKSFSIEYPSDWNINGSVFYDADEKKVAEFLPGLVDFQPNQKCFDDRQSDSVRTKLVSRKNITINKQQGVLLIEKVTKDPGGGVWFPNTYCIKNETKAFIMTFYNDNLNSDSEILFKEIVSTLELKSEMVEDVSFCGKTLRSDRIVINNIDIAKTIAKIAEKETWICKNIELGKFQESGIGIIQKKEISNSNLYLVSFFHKGDENEEKDPFNQSPYIFKFNFQDNKVFYQEQFNGSFKSIGTIK